MKTKKIFTLMLIPLLISFTACVPKKSLSSSSESSSGESLKSSSDSSSAITSATSSLQASSSIIKSSSIKSSKTASSEASKPAVVTGDQNKSVRIIGRTYAGAEGPWLSWTGSAILANIKATDIQIKLKVISSYQGSSAETGYDYINVIIDNGAPTVLRLYKDTLVYTIATGLESKTHKIEIVKRTEGLIGPIQFQGFILPKGGSFESASPALTKKIEFIGTSSICGYGNEGTSAFKASEENGYMAFGSIAARILNAEQHTIAMSGYGAYRGWGCAPGLNTLMSKYTLTIPQFTDEKSKWDFSKWIPDAVVINLGDNDFYNSDDVSEKFKEKLKEFILFVRAKYPKATIFCTTGLTPAYSVPKSAPLMQQVVNELEDNKIVFVELHNKTNISADGIGANAHPSIKTHQRIGEYLASQIKSKMGW